MLDSAVLFGAREILQTLRYIYIPLGMWEFDGIARYLKKPAGTYQRYRCMLRNVMEKRHGFGYVSVLDRLTASPIV
jgi:hypothetical protein